MNIEQTIGGIRVISGGTKAFIVLSRPWQYDINNTTAHCPFCDIKNREKESVRISHVAELHEPWLIAKNKFTRYSFHELIIPNAHWPNEKLRTLGGADAIGDFLKIAHTEMTRSNPQTPMLIGVHVGPYAGQNISHLHIHLVKLPLPIRRQSEKSPAHTINRLWSRAARLRIMEKNGYRAFAHGIRAGQCFVVPSDEINFSSCAYVDDFARVLADVIELYNIRFKSVEGLPPDFMLSLVWEKNRFTYGMYVPILNQWGCAEYIGFVENQPIGLPWPHKETVKQLLQ